MRLDNFFWSTKKNEKKTEQLVDQETDQNHMDGTLVDQKFPETDQKFPETGQFFLVDRKK